MRLSPIGDAISSPQSGGASSVAVNGVVPASLVGCAGGGWCWSDATTAYGQGDFGGGQHLYKLVLPNTLTQIDATGANLSAAGNGVVAAYLSFAGVRFPLSAFGPFPLAGLGDVSPDGMTVLVQNFAAGTGLVVRSAAGAQLCTVSVTLPGNYLIRAKNGVFAYPDTALTIWHLALLASGVRQSFAPRTEAIFQTVPVSISGTQWVVEVSATQLTLRPATSSNGFVVATGNTFSVDAVEMAAGTVRIGWSVGAGELPTQVRLADVTVGTGAQNVGTTASGSLVITAGPTLTQSAVPVGPVEGGAPLGANKQPRHAITNDPFVGGEDGKRVYQKYWDQIGAAAFAPANLSQATGTVDPTHGGTGMTTGLTIIDGGNILPGTIPCSAMASSCGGGWIPLVDGSEPPNFITDGAGVLILVPGP